MKQVVLLEQEEEAELDRIQLQILHEEDDSNVGVQTASEIDDDHDGDDGCDSENYDRDDDVADSSVL